MDIMINEIAAWRVEIIDDGAADIRLAVCSTVT
jgi:hypothetical protein